MDTITKLGSKFGLYFHGNILTTVKSSDFSERNILSSFRKYVTKFPSDIKCRCYVFNKKKFSIAFKWQVPISFESHSQKSATFSFDKSARNAKNNGPKTEKKNIFSLLNL